MSGTSLDGVDIAACRFWYTNNNWCFAIEHATTSPYTTEWKKQLQLLVNASAREIAKMHFDYGRLIGRLVRQFHEETGFDAEFISSHGHTVFHDPGSGYTTQIGSGAAIAATCDLPVVCDFRSTDVCLGGQGAPLVPIGDELLFGNVDACLNLGGFSNISLNREGQRIAFDICPVNTVLNLLSHEAGMEYDMDGKLASCGKIIPVLLDALNNLGYYSQNPPKSLGTEWVDSEIIPLLMLRSEISADKLRTFTEHAAFQISNTLDSLHVSQVLLSGGGAFNHFLVRRIMDQTSSEIIIPEVNLINYKEALVFAFLGLLRWIGETNCLASATGAVTDNIGGAVYLPAK